MITIHFTADKRGYVMSKYRESLNAAGKLTFLGGGDRLRMIEDMPVYDVERGRVVKIRDLDGPGNN